MVEVIKHGKPMIASKTCLLCGCHFKFDMEWCSYLPDGLSLYTACPECGKRIEVKMIDFVVDIEKNKRDVWEDVKRDTHN